MEQKRKKVRFNLIDTVIVIFILAVIAVAAYFLFGNFNFGSKRGNRDIQFEMRIEHVKKESLESLEKNASLAAGTTVKNAVTGDVLGTIVSFRKEKSCYYGGVVEGVEGYALGTTESEDEYDVYITVSTRASRDSRGVYTADGIRMVVGEPVYFKIKSFAEAAYIVKTDIPDRAESD
ncbi:MAG: DUF4330 family protein [Clostridia bacterium]|nr:DUF4330 family protein [Clostridia bacterium]